MTAPQAQEGSPAQDAAASGQRGETAGRGLRWSVYGISGLLLLYALHFGPLMVLIDRLPKFWERAIGPTLVILERPHFACMYYSRWYFAYVGLWASLTDDELPEYEEYRESYLRHFAE